MNNSKMKIKNVLKNKIVQGLALLVAGVAIGGLTLFDYKAKKQINEFGTVEHPKYLITNEYKIKKEDFNKELFMNKSEPSKINSVNIENELKSDLRMNYKNFQNYFYDKFSDAEKNDKILSNENSYNPEFTASEDISKNDINEVELAKEIFNDLTGKEFPSFYKIMKENDMDDSRWGYHFYLLDKIAYRDVNKSGNLRTILHEMGHMIAQHVEENLFSRDEAMLEEACAYAFANAGLHELSNNKEMKSFALFSKNEFGDDMLNRAKKFYKGGDDFEKHNSGAALFLAALYTIGDPNKTFNYLATLKDTDLDNLDPKIKEMMKYNKKIFSIK